MLSSDNSYFEMLRLIVRPFFDELRPPWNALKYVALLLLITGFIIVVSGFLLLRSEELERSAFFLKWGGALFIALFFVIYGFLWLELINYDRLRRSEREKQLTDFSSYDHR
ncbi:MAG TPA: hypothetical protein PKD37_03640 [Oligoflexia bacterium]|nr:hypothetical protein [Oligoflexia bacterium]HMP27060.1 hypothetical protein [Oligoflexia bacterium]